MEDTMIARTFKEFLKLAGPDRINSPMLSREERLTRYMPAIVMEVLERRRLLSLSVEQVGGTLEITGSSSADTINVFVNHSYDDSIHVSDGSTDYGAYWQGSVTLIKILAGGGNDSIFINRDVVNQTDVPESCLIYGDAGNDAIDAGNLGDTVYGGDGDDVIRGWEGADLLYGDSGGDNITGGDQVDTMYGGDGNDVFHSDDNWTETIWGGAGTDTATDKNAADFVVDVEVY